MKSILLAVLWIWRVSADSCTFPNEYDAASSFWSQEQLDSRLAGCTSIDGWLSIAHNYSGSFVLNNITSINGGIGTHDGGSNELTALTSVQADGLLSIQKLSIYRVSTLRNISFPDLTSIGNLELDLTSDDGEVSFPSLLNATTVSIYGPVSSMDFASLSSVSDQLSISSNNTINVPDPSNPNVKSYPPLTVDFPALQICSQVILYGNISSVSMPMLLSSTPGPDSSGGGITITTNGDPLDVVFPKLSNTTQISLTGTIGSLSFPSLIEIHGGYMVDSFYPSNFSFAPLESSTILILQGNITGLDLSTMKELQQLKIASDMPLDCTLAAETWARIQNIPLIRDPDEQHKSQAWQGFTCGSPLTLHKAGLSKATRLKIGLTIGIALPAFLILVYYLYKSFAWKAARDIKPPAYGHELDDRYGHGEDLPSYAPREAETAASLSEVSSLSDSDRERRSFDEEPVNPHEGSVHNELGDVRVDRA